MNVAGLECKLALNPIKRLPDAADGLLHKTVGKVVLENCGGAFKNYLAADWTNQPSITG